MWKLLLLFCSLLTCNYTVNCGNVVYTRQSYIIIARCHKEKPCYDAFVKWHLHIGFNKLLLIQNDNEEVYFSRQRCDEPLHCLPLPVQQRLRLGKLLVLEFAKFRTIGEYVQSLHERHDTIDTIMFRWAPYHNVDFNCFSGTIADLMSQRQSFTSNLYKTMSKVSCLERFDGSHYVVLMTTQRESLAYFEGHLLSSHNLTEHYHEIKER